jgi:TonB family protein
MSTAVAQPPVRANRRRVSRYALAIPADITVLRSGVPDTIPGRSWDISEKGVAVVLAGELRPGDSVGLEFRLPDLALTLQTKALVRHQALLRCGLQFLAVSPEQRAMIRYLVARAPEKPSEIQSSDAGSPSKSCAAAPPPPDAYRRQAPRSPRLSRVLWLALAVIVGIGGLGWWKWHQAWDELESRLPGKEARSEQSPAASRSGPSIKIPPSVMDQLVTHKVEPIYPPAARQSHVQGMVVLDARIGPDGAVEDVRPLRGPDVLAPAAVDAAKWWRFQPYRVNGKPVEVETTITIEFRPEP